MIRRRLLGIAGVCAVAVTLTLGAVVVFPAAALLDVLRGRHRLPLVHLLGFAWCWAWLEIAGIIIAGWLWITLRAADEDANYRLQAWWADRLMGALRSTCGLEAHIAGVEQLRPGPVVLLVRHASLADSLLTSWAITQVGLRPRVVMKKELLADPCLDIVGNRLPNCFVDRGAADSGPELASIARMAEGLGPRDAAVIFPEGTRSNDAKRATALERIATRDPYRAERLAGLDHLLPPRPAGASALLTAAPGADVVLAWHVGFEGLDTFGGILEALGGQRRDTHIEFRRVSRSEVPRDDGFTEWLDQQWLDLDGEVARARTG